LSIAIFDSERKEFKLYLVSSPLVGVSDLSQLSERLFRLLDLCLDVAEGRVAAVLFIAVQSSISWSTEFYDGGVRQVLN
jgi:hypothetical protein